MRAICISLLAFFEASTFAQSPTSSPTQPIFHIPSNAKKARTIVAPKPDYPKYARDRHWTGIGWYVMHVDTKTGCVRSVEVMQSSGHKILDDAVVSTFSRWRFEPGKAAPRVKSPVTFSLPVEDKKSGN